MKFLRTIRCRLVLCCILSALAAVCATAQNPGSYFGKPGEKPLIGTLKGGSGSSRGKDLYTAPHSGMAAPGMNYRGFSDERFKEFDEGFKERDWASESTAWERAKSLDSIDGYMKYTAMYPNGEHRPQASSRIIDLEVEDALNHPHENLPGFERKEADDDSPTSTIIITNNTAYPLTVMLSGTESKSIVLRSGNTGAVTVTNGRYKIAASVPARHVRPFAGIESLDGGRYEVGFWVVPM